MKQQIKQLEEFQKAFNSTYSNTPTLLSKEEWELRYKLSEEELLEYKEACEAGDLVEITDSIADRLFLIIGDAVSHGLQHILEDAFNEVVRSNMSKLGLDGRPIVNGENGVFDESRPLGKILKPSHFSEPNLKQFL